jgi:transglutaminase-like putative cysteine protease
MALRAGWAALLLATGAGQLSTAWLGTRPALVFVTAAVAPLLLLAVGSLVRVPAAVVAVAVALAAGAVAYRIVAVPAGEGLVETLRNAVPRLLTAPRPAPPTPELLLPGVLLALLTGLWVGLRTLAGRSGSAFVAAPAGAVVLYAAGALLTAGAADPYGVGAGAILVLSAAGWLVLDGPRRPWSAPVRRLAPVALVALAVALPAGLLPLAGAFEPRYLVEPPHRTLEEPSPLPRIAAWHQQGEAELLRVTAETGARLRLVALAGYTGATWSATANYRRFGVVAGASLPAGRHQAPVAAEVTVGALDGPWLPSPGRPVGISLSGPGYAFGPENEADVDVEPESGSLALRTGTLQPGLRYSVRATLDVAGIEEVTTAGVPDGAGARPYLEVPQLPWSFGEYARRVTFGASTPFEQAVALEYAVREGRTHEASAPAGSSYARLEAFLFRAKDSEVGAQVGTSEQFAAAFAVLARAVGLPTRVVVGFEVGSPTSSGERVVRGRDALAWPEVYFTGLGWYGFDPTPRAVSRSGSDDAAKLRVLDRMGQQAARAVVPVPPVALPSPAPSPSTSPSGTRAGGPLAVPFVPVAVTVAAGVLAVLLVVVSARGARRVRHRRAGDRGAWSEVLDLLVLAGRPPPRWQPAPEVAADVAAFAPVPGAPVHPALLVATAADRAMFAPDAGAGATAWPLLRGVRRAVRAAVPLRRRLAWPVDPRPLLRRHRRAVVQRSGDRA